MDPYPTYLMRVWICISRVPKSEFYLELQITFAPHMSEKGLLTHLVHDSDTVALYLSGSTNMVVQLRGHVSRYPTSVAYNDLHMYPKVTTDKRLNRLSIGSPFLKSFESHSSGC